MRNHHERKWKEIMKHFLIYTNVHKDKDQVITEKIRKFLLKRGQKVSEKTNDTGWVTYELIDGELISGIRTEDEKVLAQADCMFVLGGDGTVLQASREAGCHTIPIIGVNLGTLGYMTDVELSNLDEALERILQGDYSIESRMMLKGNISFQDGTKDKGWALNDIVITRRGSLQIIKFIIYVNGQYLNTYDADGMIITTPTGSTGYNLSAGGPLVEPKAKLIVLTPICPHSLNQRSIVLSSEDSIEIEIPEGSYGRSQTVEVSFDGSHSVPLGVGDRLKVEQSERTTEFIKLNQVSFLDILRKKMSN